MGRADLKVVFIFEFAWRSLKLNGLICPAETNVLLKALSAPGAVVAWAAPECPRLLLSLGKGRGFCLLPAGFSCVAAERPGALWGSMAIFVCPSVAEVMKACVD